MLCILIKSRRICKFTIYDPPSLSLIFSILVRSYLPSLRSLILHMVSLLLLSAIVVGAPLMTSQPICSIFWDSVTSRPVHTLLLPSHLFFFLHCLLPPFTVPCKTWWTGDMSTSVQFPSLYDGQEVFLWADYLLDVGKDFLIGNMVFVWDA